MLSAVGTIKVKDSTLITATKTAHSKLVHGPDDGSKPPDARKSQLLWRLYPISLLSFFFTPLGDLTWAANRVPCTFSQLKH